MNEKEKLCERYRKFAVERLQSDYDEMITLINSVVDEVKEYETLLLFINKIKVSWAKKLIVIDINYVSIRLITLIVILNYCNRMRIVCDYRNIRMIYQ